MNIANIVLLTLICSCLVPSCTPTDDETRLKRREILYRFAPLSGDCVAIFGAGAIHDTTPDGALALLGEDLNKFRYLGIEGSTMHIDLPWPYSDIDVPVTMERNDYGYRIKSTYEEIVFFFTTYRMGNDISVLRIDGKFCHDMPQFLKEHLLATWIKNIIKTTRDRRG